MLRGAMSLSTSLRSKRSVVTDSLLTDHAVLPNRSTISSVLAFLLRRNNGAPCIAESDSARTGCAAAAAKRDFVAILEKRAVLSIWKFDWPSTAPRAFEEA